jgi:hypothetical protein
VADENQTHGRHARVSLAIQAEGHVFKNKPVRGSGVVRERFT